MTIVDTELKTPGTLLEIESGMILVNSLGNLRILRSRTREGDGWNCADGASVADADVNDTDKWRAYKPADLAADLALARDLRAIAGERELSGGLATWDACSGRRCVLPKLAKIVN